MIISSSSPFLYVGLALFFIGTCLFPFNDDNNGKRSLSNFYPDLFEEEISHENNEANLNLGYLGPRTLEEKKEIANYVPSQSESYVMQNIGRNVTSGCDIYTNENSLVRTSLIQWSSELKNYYLSMKMVKEFSPDVRKLFNDDYSNRESVCHTYSDPPELDREGNALHSVSTSDARVLRKKINNSNTLKKHFFSISGEVSYSDTQGYMEPLLPPLRHPDFCLLGVDVVGPCSMEYLVEDFGHVCRQASFTRESETVFIDIGATYSFAEEIRVDHNSPVISIVEKYRKFGIHFDHLYAYEVVQWDVDRVYRTIPRHMMKAMHWINSGVNITEGSIFNPWTILMENFKPDDFVIVKLDIDTPEVELPLVQQLLNTPLLHDLVDVFYFEHHIVMDEMSDFWRMNGTMIDSLQIFQQLRDVGIASHYWI